MIKQLLQFYAANPSKILTCPLEVEDFAEYGFVFTALKDHVEKYDSFDSVAFGIENTSAFLELDLSDAPYFNEGIEPKLISSIREERVKNIYAKSKDLSDIELIQKLRQPLQVEKNVSAKDGIHEFFETFAETADRRERTGSVGLPISLRMFQEHPLIPNTLLVVGARTSIGKSAFALNMAYDLAETGGRTLYMTAEMDYNSILARFYSLATNIPVTDFIQASDSSVVSKAYDRVQELKGDVEFKYCGGWEWSKVKAYIMSQKDFDMVVFDHLHYLPVPSKNEVQFLTDVINDAKIISGQMRNVFVMVAQVNRAAGSESDRPEVYHLRGSGGIEQGADMIAMLHRPDRAEPQGEIFIAKDRGGVAGDRYEILLNRHTLRVS